MKERKKYYYLVRDFREIREGERRSMGRGWQGWGWGKDKSKDIYLIMDFSRYIGLDFFLLYFLFILKRILNTLCLSFFINYNFQLFT